MELKSEQQNFTLVQVTDLDIAFPGDLQTYTIKDGQDKLVEDQYGDLVLTFASGGEMKFNMHHAHWYAKRHRTIRVPIPQEPTRAE